MMKLIHSDQPIIKSSNTKLINSKTKSGVGADQYLVITVQKCAQCFDLTAIVGAGGVTQVPLWLHVPISPETIIAQRLIIEAGTNGSLRHHDNGLLDILTMNLIQRDKH